MAGTQEVFELVLARPVLMEHGVDGGLVHLWWRAPQQGERLAQVYVDGELYDVTAEAEQREMWLVLEEGAGHRIELLAVEAGEIWQEQREALTGWLGWTANVAEVVIERDERLAAETRVEVAVDGEVVERRGLWDGEGEAWGWRSVGLSAGAHEIEVRAVDEGGGAAALPVETQVEVGGVAQAAGARVEDGTVRWG